MGTAVEAAVGADEGAGADGDGAGVHEGAVEVYEYTWAEVDVYAVVGVDGGEDPGVEVEESVIGGGGGGGGGGEGGGEG